MYYFLISDLKVFFNLSNKSNLKDANADTDLLNTASGGGDVNGHNSEILRLIVTIQSSCWELRASTQDDER